MTMQEVVKKYNEAREFHISELKANGRSPKSIETRERTTRQFIEFFQKLHEGEEEVNSPRYADFQAWRDYLVETGISTSSLELYMKEVQRFFKSVSDEELGDMQFYEKNPLPSRVIPSAKKEQAKPYQQILEDEQVAMLWKNEPVRKLGVSTSIWPKSYAIVVLLLATEIRNSELLDLKLSDVDFEYGEIQIWAGKGNKYRCVDCPEIALTAIQLYLQSGLRPEGLSDDDYLFGTTKTKVFGGDDDSAEWHRGSRQWLHKLVSNHIKNVTGVEFVGTHDLRHIGARVDLHNGMRAEELQSKLGHAELRTTQIYSGKLGTQRKRVTASGVYLERDIQTARNKMMLQGA